MGVTGTRARAVQLCTAHVVIAPEVDDLDEELGAAHLVEQALQGGVLRVCLQGSTQVAHPAHDLLDLVGVEHTHGVHPQLEHCPRLIGLIAPLGPVGLGIIQPGKTLGLLLDRQPLDLRSKVAGGLEGLVVARQQGVRQRLLHQGRFLVSVQRVVQQAQGGTYDVVHRQLSIHPMACGSVGVHSIPHEEAVIEDTVTRAVQHVVDAEAV
mmetsp:Transcript_33865/g.75104  ORF Transcript_33865/g.75104 Transcript_33865/m.75104 type:complete len:209 (-) Transcript_33865:880-1506(-)